MASGALLPVTLALGADLWAQRNRAGILGGIGAAQELGSVLGPLYGILVVWLTSRWQDVFWINVPLALAAMVMIHFSLPSKDRSAEPEKIDIIGGLLLAITLGLAVIGLYNANPDGKHALPSYGPPLIVAAVVAAVVFVVWERFARTKLIEPAGVHFRPFLSALGSSLCAGAALMVTLVDVELFVQGVWQKDQNYAAFVLLWFLAALPVGALAGRVDRHQDRRPSGDFHWAVRSRLAVTWLISTWRIDLSTHRAIFPRPHRATGIGGRRPGIGFGDRAADIGQLAGGAVSAAWHRLSGGRGGADDGHADRGRFAECMGFLPPPPTRRRGGQEACPRRRSNALITVNRAKRSPICMAKSSKRLWSSAW